MSVIQMHGDAGPLAATVARRVRGLLAEEGMAQQDLAPVLGVSGSSTSKRIRGLMPFALDELPAVANALGTSIEYLLGLTDERRPRRAMLDEASDELRARRDSNPKPSDLESDAPRAVDLSAWRQRSARRRQMAAVS